MNQVLMSLAQRFGFGPDPLDDSLNNSWDVVVGQDRGASIDPESDDVTFLRRLHALEAVSLPSPAFFGELEHRLTGLYPVPVHTPEPATRVSRPQIGSALPAPSRRNRPPRTHRPIFMRGAFAVVAILLVASLLVLYQAIPRSSDPRPIPAATLVEPTMESMLQLDVTPALFGIPEASTWTHMYFNLIEVAPGDSFTTDTDWYTSIEGPLLIVVLSGELAIEPDGPALYYPAGQQDHNPVETSPGQSISLEPDEAIVYSAVDPAAGSNQGNEPALALQVSLGRLAFSGSGTESSPIDVRNLDKQQDWGIHAPSTAGASLSIQRLTLAPLDSFVFEPDPEWTYLCVFDQFQMEDVRMAKGEHQGLSPKVETEWLHGSTQLTYPDPGPHTIFNLGSETVDFYFFVVEPLPDDDTPAA